MHSITVDTDRRLVEVVLAGVVRFPERAEVFDKLIAAVKAKGCDRVLVVYRPGTRVALENFENSSAMADSLAGDPLLQGCRMAYVAPLGGRLDIVTEMLAYARGFPGRRFRHREDALAWLMDAPTPA